LRQLGPIGDAPAAGDATPLSSHGMRIARLDQDTVVVKRGIIELKLAFDDAADTVERLAQLADGTVTADRLVEAFPPELRDHVGRLVTGLRARGLLRDATGVTLDATAGRAVIDDPAALFWAGLASHAPNARGALAEASVLVAGTGPVTDALAAALHHCGVGRVRTIPTFTPARPPRAAGHATVGDDTAWWDARWDVWCAATDGPPEPWLVEQARAALTAGALFLPVWLDDLVIRVGPLTHPGDTACLRCYLLRLDSNDPHREVHRLLRAQQPSPAGHLPPMAAVAGAVAATETVKHLTGLPVTACGRVIELSLVPFRAGTHRVLRVPRCPECSGTARRSAPVVAHGPLMKE
jgi:bacteriocin biosynthesis cyclodehydratase domain-containing protein